MKKRVLPALLALCIVLVLLPAEALADGDAEAVAPPDREDAVSAPLPENAPQEAEEAALPAVSGGEEASIAGEDTFIVTTGDAADVTEFSATLSMTVEGNWYPYGKYMKIYGFQYCFGDKFDERTARDWEDYNVTDTNVNYVDATHFTYTGPVACMPGTTYTYRAYFLIGDDYGNTWEFFANNVKTFTTPGVSEELAELTPGNPISFDLTGGQSAQFLLGGGVPAGFYNLSSELSSKDYVSSSLSIEKNGSWSSFYSDTPIWLDSQPRYGKLTLNASKETRAKCTVTLSPYEMTELQAGAASGPFVKTTYLTFTPKEPGKTYKLTFSITENAGNTSSYLGNLSRWSMEDEDWRDYTLISDGSAYLLSPEGGEACYLMLALYGSASCTVTVSDYTPAAALSVRSGEARAVHLFSANVPVMGEMPDGYDPAKISAGIEYQVDGITRTAGASGAFSGGMWTVQSDLELFPGKTYRYRAFAKVREDNSGNITETAWEQEWHTFTAPMAEPIQLSLDQTTSITPSDDPIKFLSFTPAESGRYTVSMERLTNKAFWNAEEARWVPDYTADGESAVVTLTAGVPLYIRAWVNSYLGASITISRFASSVTEFSISAENPTNIQDFSARLTLNASVPIGSSFRVGVELNGIDMPYNTVRNYNKESWSDKISLYVLPNTTYTCKAYIEELDTATNRPVTGSRRYGNEITFTTGVFSAVELPVNSSVTQEASYQRQYFYFTPGTDGYYHVSVTGGQPGSLLYWNPAIGRWDGGSYFSGSTEVLLSEKAGVPQYLQLYPSAGNAAEFQIEITPFTSSVTDFSVKAGGAETVIPGFTTSASVETEVPIGSYCRIGLEVLQDNGYWTSSGGSSWVNSANGEKQTLTCSMVTLPNKTCTYRAYLVPTDSNGMELTGVPPVYSQPMQFTSSSYSPDTTTVLAAGAAASGTFQEDVYFTFTPPEAGVYRIEVTGARNLMVSRSDNSGWTNYYQFEEPVVVSMENTQRYFRLSGSRNQSYSIQVSRVVSAVDGFTVTANEAAAAGLEFQVPVTVTAPIGSQYSYGVQYCLSGSSQWLSDERAAALSASETRTYQLTLPAYPGKTYTYRAYVYDRNTRETYYEDVAHTVQMPELAAEPAALTEGGWLSAGGKEAYSFTPAKTGNYLFSADGYNGTLVILLEDGTWRRLNYYVGYEMAITVPLQANQRVYVIQDEYMNDVSGSVMVRTTALRAVMNQNGAVVVTMDVETAGQYVFAAYNRDGRLLATGIVNKTGNTAETLTSTLSAGSDTAYVKAFQLNAGSCKPLASAERSPIEYRYF